MFTLDQLVEEIGHPTGGRYRNDTIARYRISPFPVKAEVWGVSKEKTYCPACGKDRHFKIDIVKGTGVLTRVCRKKPITSGSVYDTDEFGPSLLQFTCENCDLVINSIVYDGPEGPFIASFPNRIGGLSTPETPKNVAYFLNQAYKCVCIGANGSAVAMFRVALEQLLHDEGYTDGTLADKIKALKTDIESNKAKAWAMDLNTGLLTSIQRLGNAAVHPKDLANLKQLDDEAVVGAMEVFQHLLVEIYDRPRADEKFLARLKKKGSEV